ncbi:MAG: nicotinate phosphoribosyltransferase [Desulfobacter sp.]|nr:MAG: nicotinate phosphoribosyltransferase [Desulfobacter sp.]
MIQSILDNDLYKFTMQQAVLDLYPEARVAYELTNRGGTPFPPKMAREVQKKINTMASLSLTLDEKAWLEDTCPYFTPAFLRFLSEYRYDPEEVSLYQEKSRLFATIKGPWYRTILWEVPLMAMISQTYFEMTAPKIMSRDDICQRNRRKAKKLASHQVSFVDFGTRRRFSFANHEDLIKEITRLPGHTLLGTSNVHLAQKFNIAPIGTLAHEWIMFHSGLGNYKTANESALEAWVKVYQGNLSIALTDTYTTDAFLTCFEKPRATLFDGVRHDSGDPIEFARKIITHYQGLGIDPKTKTIVFSDSLDPDRAIDIHRFCRGKFKDIYGIGTNLTNDVGTTPLNIVIKLCQCNAGPGMPLRPTVKLSDDKGKHTGDKTELLQCMKTLGI